MTEEKYRDCLIYHRESRELLFAGPHDIGSPLFDDYFPKRHAYVLVDEGNGFTDGFENSRK